MLTTDSSLPPSSKPPSTTPTSTPQRKKSSPLAWIEVPQTKTTRASTRTSSPAPSPMWRRSTTRRTRAAGVTRRWRMRTGTTGKGARRMNRRRRRSRRTSDGQAQRKGRWQWLTNHALRRALVGFNDAGDVVETTSAGVLFRIMS